MNTDVIVREEKGFDYMVPQSFDDAWQICERLASSDLVPKDYHDKPANVFVAIEWGREIGLKPLQALQNIAVINGRPKLWGDAVLALVTASPVCKDVIERYEGEGEGYTAVCIAQRHGKEDKVRRFSIADARQAGLLSKQSPWQGYPDRMLQMRARGFALRDQFSDVLGGFDIAETAQEDAKNMGAVEEVDPETGELVGRTRTAQANAALRKVELDRLLKDIDEAGTPDAMKACAARAAKLTDEGDREAARKHYAAKLEAVGAGKGKKAKGKAAAAAEGSLPLDEVPASDAPPLVTFAIVAEALKDAKSADEVREAAAYIEHVKEAAQRVELNDIAEARLREFDEAGGA